MAVKRFIPLTQINGIAAGATSTINLPLGVRYHSIHLQYTTTTAGGPTEATMVLEIGDIRVNINGVVQRVMKMQDLFNINRTKGRSPTVGASFGYVDILFREPQRRTTAEREATAWGTQNVGTFTVEVDVLNNANQTATLKGWAVVDDITEPPQGIVKWSRQTIQIAATGVTTYSLGTGKGEAVQGMYFIEQTAGDITAMQLLWDNGLNIWNIDQNIQPDLENFSDFTIVAKVRHAYLDYNDPSAALPMVKQDPTKAPGNFIKVGDFSVNMTMGAAHNVVLYRENIGGPN